jgi:hypothetical protein
VVTAQVHYSHLCWAGLLVLVVLPAGGFTMSLISYVRAVQQPLSLYILLVANEPVQAIYDYFEKAEPGLYKQFDDMFPIVTCQANFDEILIPADHVSRSANDTYYVSSEQVLRCHTSAHQAELLRTKQPGFLVTGGCKIGSGPCSAVLCWDADVVTLWMRLVAAAQHSGLAFPQPQQAFAALQMHRMGTKQTMHVCVSASQVTCTVVTALTPPTTPCSTRWRV